MRASGLTWLLAWLTLLSAMGWAQAANPVRKSGVKRAPVNYTAAYNSYLNRLRAKVLSNWNLPDGKNRVVLQATVEADGAVNDLVVKSTPSNANAEQAANAAFAQAQPLPPLSGGSPPARLTLTFDSFSDPHGDTTSNLLTRMDPVPPPKLTPASSPP